MVDSLNHKNSVLKEKLASMGAYKMPSSEIEKKLFFTENEKMLKECSLTSDIHDEIRRTF